MITKKQYIELKSLEAEKERLLDFKKNFGRNHVWSKVGIVEVNGAASTKVRESEHAGYFHNKFTDLRDKFEEVLIDDINAKISAIESKMALYLEGEE